MFLFLQDTRGLIPFSLHNSRREEDAIMKISLKK